MTVDSGPQRIGVPERLDAVVEGGRRLVGRDGFLDRIAERLGTSQAIDEAVALVPAEDGADTATLHGMGGVGKTALALEFCYSSHSLRYDVIWWVNADSSSTIDASYDLYARQVLGAGHELQGDDLRDAVHADLRTRVSCLVVYDNLLDRQSLREYRPADFNGAVLVTSRSPRNWAAESAIQVDVLDEVPARDWLLYSAGCVDKFGDSIDTDSAEYQHAAWLAGSDGMNGLALALRMATTYLEGTPGGLREYRSLYDSRASDLLNSSETIPPDYARTVYVTFAVSLAELVRSKNIAAKTLLELASFFAPDDIPATVFTPDSIGAGGEAEGAVNEALLALSRLALVTTSRIGFGVHRLVQEVTRYYLRNPLPELDLLEAQASGRKISVMAVSANPPDLNDDQLDIERAIQDIKELVDTSDLRDQIEFRQVGAATAESVARNLRKSPRPSIVVFVGHGRESDGIALRNHHGDEGVKWASADSLAETFQDIGAQVVILANCHSEGVAKKLAEHVPTVIGTTTYIADQTARRLVETYLRAVLRGTTMAEAYKEAQHVIDLAGGEDVTVLLGSGASLTLFN